MLKALLNNLRKTQLARKLNMLFIICKHFTEQASGGRFGKQDKTGIRRSETASAVTRIHENENWETRLNGD
jgi:hypothetical protein